MSDQRTLREAYREAPYPLSGHGPRTVQVLKDALQQVSDGQASDTYGSGSIIEPFQNKMADFLGKESAVFFPSGTMAQQIALRIWSDRKATTKVAYHPLCHLEIREEGGLKYLHRLESVLLGTDARLITLEDVHGLDGQVGALLLELPQREMGGELPDFETLQAISDWCRARDIKLHLDGARLYECLPYYQKSAAEVAELFDSVYISFYKGVGGVAGAILAGPGDFIQEAKVWKRRHGGDLISLYPYIVAADYYFDRRVPKMSQYVALARELASYFNRLPGTHTHPEVPPTNMFHVHLGRPPAVVEPILAAVTEETGVGFAGGVMSRGTGGYFEISVGDGYERVPKDRLDAAFRRLSDALGSLN